MAVEETQTTLITEKDSPGIGASSNEKSGKAAETRGHHDRQPGFKDFIRIFSYATKLDIAIYILASVASIGAGTTMPLMNIVFGSLAGQFTNYFMQPPRMTKPEFEAVLDQLALFIMGLFLGRFVLNCINKFCFRMIGVRLSSAIRLHYIESLFSQSVHVLDSMPSGSAASTITGTANTLQIGISEKLGTFMEFNGTIWCSIIVAFIWSWKLTLVTFSLVIFILAVVSTFMPFIVRLQDEQSKSEARANGVASESFSSIRMLTACGAQKTMSARYARWVDEARAKGQRSAPLLALQFGLVFFGTYAVFGLSFWFGTKQFVDGELSNPGTIVVVLMSVMMIIMSLERISNPLMAVSRAMVAACEFFVVIDAPRPITGSLREPDVVATDDIVFKDVTFAYPSRPHVKILDNLNLTIEAGKNTAIVGPSGSGKSTVVGLVERWYDLREQHIIKKTIGVEKINGTEDKTKKKKSDKKFSKRKQGHLMGPVDSQEEPVAASQPIVSLSGNITTGGKALTDIDLKWWRSQIGLVQQEPFLFNDTVFRNVAYGLIGSAFEECSEEAKRQLVREACHEAFADEFIDRLPDGYDTAVGDGGAKLSGGQRQRIAIARSIVRKPKIIILDEATSAIDVRGEKIVQAALDRVAKDRTTITIAHRLSTIKKADRIVVLHKGQVIESGTHDSLLRNESGAYHSLVHAQKLSLGQTTEVDDVTSGEDSSDQGVDMAEPKTADAPEVSEEIQQSRSKEPNVCYSFFRLLAEQENRWVYLAIAFFAACSAASTPLMAWLFANIFQVFTYADTDKVRSESQFWSLMWVALAVGVGLGYFFQGAIAIHVQHKISAVYKKEYFESILHQRTAFFDNDENSHGTLVARVAGDPKQLEQLLGLNMSSLVMAVFNIIGALSIAYAFGWKLALVAMFVTMPAGLFAGYWKFKYELEFEKMNAAVFAESSRFAAEAIGAFRTVTSLTMENVIHSRYDRLLRSHVSEAYRKARWTSLLFGLADSVSLGCQGLIFWYGGRLLASREYGLVNFFVCFMAVIQGAEAAGTGFSYGPDAAQASAAANRIISLRNTDREDDTGTTEQIPDTEGGIKIELKNAHFRYPTRNTPVFTGIDLTVNKEQFAALVGPSGCGKTSVISLLERFYSLDKGDILCNGKSIYSLNAAEYRKNMSLVAQEPCMFQGTIRENICLGVEADTISDERLHQICRDASIHDFIVSLPEGYNTDIGSKGFSLSGGQKQRISIARALIRDPKILLLDEATSSLDSESEKLVQAAFERASKGRTMICVAHRLATVQNADVIFVLGEGKVVEKGTHQELLRMKGIYWQMCQSQALDR
ncbi:P-loop containing nucleoside triphosphate hydrolase protein [Colletotrichum zoysiae]|uniref:P-loop containing nucleoside triphosphate hydrolase protein n=1 Tax=Colletotrichum zoysiae TaxID=1216348 RepID=A0AAD9M4I1_9PEZI|nr:P-loop containing nucleoside triphosphate hydrolase protein [Colletotrichum zoysiae]